MIIMEDVTKTYSSGSDVPALNGINLHIQEGEFVFIRVVQVNLRLSSFFLRNLILHQEKYMLTRNI